MGVSISTGGGGRKDVDAEINLVPFIDMMSCLVAFLLITAVWTNIAQINIKPKGMANTAEDRTPPPPRPNVSILIAQDAHWIGISTTGEREQIKKPSPGADADYDWKSLGDILRAYKEDKGFFNDRNDIEIAAEDGVKFQAIISTMDAAIMKGFTDVGYVDPPSLSVKHFKQ